MKLFKRKEEKNKVGRPKLADDETKKKAIISVCVALVLVITLALTGAFKLNIIKFNKLKGTVNVSLCSEIPAEFQPGGNYEYGFTDPKFYSAVVSTYNEDASYCSTITEEQLNSIVTLEVDASTINNAEGVQYLSGLDSLNISGNYNTVGNLKTIDVSKNIYLTNLKLNYNNISVIDVSANLQLTDLELNNNNLSSIDVSYNPKLTWLFLGDNNIDSIDLSNNSWLIQLNIYNNKISNIDVSNNKSLKAFSIYGNNLSEIDVSQNKNLFLLELGDNNFEKTYISNGEDIQIEFPNIKTAFPDDTSYTINNPSVAIYDNSVIKKVKTGETALKIEYKISENNSINIYYNIYFSGITSSYYAIDEEKMEIDLNGKILSKIYPYEFISIPSNYSKIINDNKIYLKDDTGKIIKTYTFKNYVLYKLTSQYYTINEEDKTIDLNKDLLNSVYVGKFSTNSTNYSLNINKDKLEIKDNSGNIAETYKFINYSEYKLGSSYYMVDVNSKTINAKNDIFTKNKMWINPSNLYELRVNDNKLEILNLDKEVVDSYEIINAKINDEDAYLKAGFKDKNLYTCVVRQYVDDENIEGNYLLSDEEMQNINELYCINQNVTDTTGIEKLTNLNELFLPYNNIESIDLSKYPNLNTLIIRNGKLTSLDVSKNPDLQYIDASYNNINKITGLEKLEELGFLIAYNNNLSNLDLSKTTNLELLMLGNNPLSNTLYMLRGKEADYKKDFILNEAYEIKYDVVDTNVVSYKDSKLKALKEGITNIYISTESMIYNYKSDLWDKSMACEYLMDQKVCEEFENIPEEEFLLPYLINQEIKVYDITSKAYKIDKDKKTIDALNKDFDASKINLTLNGLTGTLENGKFIIKDGETVVDTYAVKNIKQVVKEEVVSDSSNGTKVKPSDKVIEKLEERKEKAEEKLEDIIVETDKVPLATLLLVKGTDRNIIVKSDGIKITINGKDIDKVTSNIDLSYELKVLKESIISEDVIDKIKNGMVLRFKNNKEIPYKMLIEIEVTDKIEKEIGRKNLYLYNYNNDKYSLVAENISSYNNKISFYINKQGNYILTNNKIEDKSVKTDKSIIEDNTKLVKEINYKKIIIPIIIFILLIILGIIGYVRYKKNKNKND